MFILKRNQAFDEGSSLEMLPERLRAEIAIHVHLDTLRKVSPQVAQWFVTLWRGEEQGSKYPFSLLSEPISLPSLLFIASIIQVHAVHFSLLPTFLFLPSPISPSPYFSLLPTFFEPFLPPPYSVPPPLHKWLWVICSVRVHDVQFGVKPLKSVLRL